MTVKAKYLEDPENPSREFYNDIPARDLDEEEFAALSTEQQERVRGSKIYQVSGSARTSAASAAAESPKE